MQKDAITTHTDVGTAQLLGHDARSAELLGHGHPKESGLAALVEQVACTMPACSHFSTFGFTSRCTNERKLSRKISWVSSKSWRRTGSLHLSCRAFLRWP